MHGPIKDGTVLSFRVDGCTIPKMQRVDGAWESQLFIGIFSIFYFHTNSSKTKDTFEIYTNVSDCCWRTWSLSYLQHRLSHRAPKLSAYTAYFDTVLHISNNLLNLYEYPVYLSRRKNIGIKFTILKYRLLLLSSRNAGSFHGHFLRFVALCLFGFGFLLMRWKNSYSVYHSSQISPAS